MAQSFTNSGSTIGKNPYATQTNSYNPYANNFNSGNKINTDVSTFPKVATTPAAPKTTSGMVNTSNNGSVVDYLNSKGQASDYTSRTGLASKYGIQNYSGTADQNTQLLNYLKGGSTPTPAPVSQNPAPVATSQSNPTNTSTTPGMVTLGNVTPKYTNDSNLFGNVVTGLANTPTDNTAFINANNRLAQLKENIANQGKNIETSGIDTSLATGQQGVLNKINAVKLGAAEDAVQNALTAQTNQITALNNAGNLAKPITGIQYGTQVYNPTTGTFQGGGSPSTAGTVEASQNLAQQYATNLSTVNQATGIKDIITQSLNTSAINPSDFTKVNDVLSLLNGQVSNPQYQILSQNLNEYINTLASIIGVGGNPTNLKTEIANSMLNGRMSPQAINAQLDNLEVLAKAKLQQQAQTVDQLNQQIQGSSGSGSIGSSWGNL